MRVPPVITVPNVRVAYWLGVICGTAIGALGCGIVVFIALSK